MRADILALSLVLGFSTTLAAPASGQEKDDQELGKQARKALARGILFLQKSQQDGKWEHEPLAEMFPGGGSSLVLLALLEGGGKAEDKDIASGLEYMRTLAPQHTYVRALQTIVFCRAAQAESRRRIEQNVDVLLRNMQRDFEGQCRGWTYGRQSASGLTDHSNSEFAVWALVAASRAGVKIEQQVWKQIRRFYLETRARDGGWTYAARNSSRQSGEGSTLAMTCAGLCGLLMVDERLNDQREVTHSKDAQKEALVRLAKLFNLKAKPSPLFALHGLSRVRQLYQGPGLGAEHKKRLDGWYREGVRMILRQQHADGSWEGDTVFDRDPLIATSLAVLFLSAQ
jgi:hypothetical protein